MKTPLALALLAGLAAAPVLAHSPRNSSPLARLDALAMPGLAPARALMAEMLDDLDPPAARHAVPVIAPHEGHRRILPFFWGWWRAPVVVSRHSGPRCEVFYSPFAGRVETCTVAPYVPLPRTRYGVPELHDRLESR